MLRHPFWLDEAWVADSLRAPLRQVPRLTSSTPIGFTYLIRLVPAVLGDERARLVPLLFTAALAPVGYLLGRELDPESRGTATVLAFACVALPAAMQRHDLKQYTADAFVAVALLLLATRAERLRTPHALARLTAAAVAGLLVSHTTALVGGATYAALVVAFASRRAWRATAYAFAAGTVFVAAVGVDYWLVGRRGATPALVHYWDLYYLPGRGHLGTFLGERAAFAARQVGLGPWGVALPLLLLGSAVLWAYGRRAAALMLPLLSALMVLAAGLHAYPLWEGRTTLFACTVGLVVAVIGLAWVARLGARWLPLLGTPGLVAIVTVLAWRSVTFDNPLPQDGVRTAARYVAAHGRPGDTIVVDARTAYQWAYYWRRDRPYWVNAADRAVGFMPEYAFETGIRIVRDAGVPTGPRALAGYVSASPTGTTWVVLSHNSRHDSYLNAATDLGTVEYRTDGRGSYYLIKVTRRP
jgi:hypothetical protein